MPTILDQPTIADLPTVEECHEFMDTINQGRKVIGLDEIDRLDYDECEPNQGKSCLSAHHLFVRGQPSRYVGVNTVTGLPPYEAKALGNVWHTRRDEALGGMTIPLEILRVTKVFDASVDSPELHNALRDRLVEAGLVETEVPT